MERTCKRNKKRMEGTTSELNEQEVVSEEQETPSEVNQNEISFREALELNMQEETSEGEKEDTPAAVPEQEVKAEQDASVSKKETVEDKQDVTAPIVAPAQMNAEEKAAFEKADPKLKSYLSRRATEDRAALSREFQKLRDMGKGVERYVNAVKPHQDYLAKHKVDPVMALENAIAWDKAMKQDKNAAAKQWLEANGVDPYALIDDDAPENRSAANQEGSQVYTPEQINELVQQQVNNILGEKEAQQQYMQSSQKAANVFKSFAEDSPLFKDPGTAERVKAGMAPLLAHFDQNGMPPGVDEKRAFELAYQTALNNDPELKRALDAYNQASVAEQAKQRSQQARQASSSISGGLAGANANTKNLSFNEELRLRMNGAL